MPKPNKKKNKAANGSPKREAILKIGIDKPTKEIVEAAKASGVSISGTYVQLLKKELSGGGTKAPAKAKSKPAAKSTKATGATNTAAKSKKAVPGTMSKSALIRSMPNASPADIVAAAKTQGLEFSEKYVSTIRSNERKSAKSGAKKNAAPKAVAPVAKRGPGRPRKVASAPATAPSFASVQDGEEKAMRAAATALVLSRGIDFARSVLDGVVARILAAGNG